MLLGQEPHLKREARSVRSQGDEHIVLTDHADARFHLLADAKMTAFLRDRYRRKYLEAIAPDVRSGETPGGNWYELIGSSYFAHVFPPRNWNGKFAFVAIETCSGLTRKALEGLSSSNPEVSPLES